MKLYGTCLIHKEGEERKNHKYIKREKIKGKWRYWYKDTKGKLKNKIEKVKDDLGFDEREALISKTKERNALVEKNSIDKRNYKDYQIKLKYDNKNVDVKNQYNKAASQYMKSTSKLTVTNAQVESFTEKYAKTPIGKLETSIQKGLKFAKDILGITDKKEYDEFKKSRKEEYEETKRREQLEEQERKKKEEREFSAKENLRHSQEERQRTERLEDFNDLSVKKSESSVKDDMAAVNPFYYSRKKLDYQTNCYSCSAAYDLRRRGYDVEAIADGDRDGATITEVMSWYTIDKKDLKRVKVNTSNLNEVVDNIEKDLKKQGDGARGMFLTQWKRGSGHAVIWEVDNGEVLLRDCQTNETVSVYDYAKLSKTIQYFRTDNVDVNTSVLEVVRNKSDNFVENNNLNKVSNSKKNSNNETKKLLDSIIDKIIRSEKEEDKKSVKGGSKRR